MPSSKPSAEQRAQAAGGDLLEVFSYLRDLRAGDGLVEQAYEIGLPAGVRPFVPLAAQSVDAESLATQIVLLLAGRTPEVQTIAQLTWRLDGDGDLPLPLAADDIPMAWPDRLLKICEVLGASDGWAKKKSSDVILYVASGLIARAESARGHRLPRPPQQPHAPQPPTPQPRADSAVDTGGGRVLAPDPVPLLVEGRLGDVLLDASILDYRGVDLSRVAVRAVGDLEDRPEHPAIIREARARVPAPEPNLSKAHLIEWHAPVEDQGNALTLDVARSDFWTSVATRDRIGALQEAIESGSLDLVTLPRRLDVHLVVVAGLDDKILLTRRGTHVATEPGTWMITVGESIDWDRDGDGAAPHPVATARRCLEDLDELHLPRELTESAEYSLIAIATEWNEMLANLIVLAEVPGLSVDAARAVFRRGENIALDAIDYSLESGRDVVDAGVFAPEGRAPTRVSDISRVALLAALRHRFGPTSI